MTSLASAGRFLGAAILGAFIAACGDKPPDVSGPSKLPTVASIRIEGPSELAPGASTQFKAFLRMTDGTEVLATPRDVTWAAEQPRLRVDQNGFATAGEPWGLAFLHVNLKVAPEYPIRVVHEVVVQPAGTFRMFCHVTDAEIGNHGLSEVSIEIRDSADPYAPVIASGSTGSGGYNVFGAPGSGYIHVRRAGYHSIVQRYQIERHTIFDFLMHADPSSLMQLAGTYTMMVEATQCDPRQPLPQALRRRQYTATITQSGASVTGRLSDATFHGSSNHFSGVVTPSWADIGLSGFYDKWEAPTLPMNPDVAELLPDGTVLVVYGGGRLTGTAARLSGTLDVAVQLYERPTFPVVNYIGGCGMAQVTLTRK